MKILGIILAVLMLSLSSFVGVMGANKSFDAGSSISEVTEGMDDKSLAALDLPSPGRLKFGGVVGILGALAAFGLIVVTFVKRPLVQNIGIATLLLCAVAIVIYPTIPTGPADGMAPRTQAIVAAVMALIGAGGAFLAKRASQSRTA